MKSFAVTAKDRPEVYTAVEGKGGGDTYQFDFAPWAEDNANVTDVSWSVEAGTASISGQALDSNVASALVTFPNAGTVLIKLTPTAGGPVPVAFLKVRVRDPAVAEGALLDGHYYR